jgi:hypothetical protein
MKDVLGLGGRGCAKGDGWMRERSVRGCGRDDGRLRTGMGQGGEVGGSRVLASSKVGVEGKDGSGRGDGWRSRGGGVRNEIRVGELWKAEDKGERQALVDLAGVEKWKGQDMYSLSSSSFQPTSSTLLRLSDLMPIAIGQSRLEHQPPNSFLHIHPILFLLLLIAPPAFLLPLLKRLYILPLLLPRPPDDLLLLSLLPLSLLKIGRLLCASLSATKRL